MKTSPAFPELLAEAKRNTRLLSFEDLEDGRVEVLWVSRQGRLAPLQHVVRDRAETALRYVLALEELRYLVRAHGSACTCEDCLVAKMDFRLDCKP